MATSIDQQIRRRLDEFVTELDALVRQAAVESVSLALGDGASRSGRAPHASRQRGANTLTARTLATPSRGRKKGQKRDPKDLEQLTQRLLSCIAKNSGQRVEQIAAEMGTTTKQLALPAKKLIASKKVRTTGTRRATRYFAR